MENQKKFKSGFVSVVGRPNVGKSTFMNRVIGEKLAIMSDKAQTTRNSISGIATDDDSQIVYVDTPGIHKPKNKLDDYMDKSALTSLTDANLILFMVSATETRGAGDNYIIDQLKKTKCPVFLVINKIDEINPDKLLPIMDTYKRAYPWADVFPISARNGNNVSELIEAIREKMPEGPQYYPDDEITDHPERFFVSELIREKILELTGQEVPHEVAVAVESFKQKPGEKVQIAANIIVERRGQRGIIIGNGGAMIKKIGILARKDIEQLLGKRVNLKLWVKVMPGWRSNPTALKELGFRTDSLG